MVLAVYICDNIEYKIESIDDSSFVEVDVKTVEDQITDISLDTYKENMVKAIEQKLAFSIYRDSTRVGFVYNYVEDFKYIGASIWIHSDMVSMLVGLRTIFEISDAHKLVFVPHKEGIRYFKSMVKGSSIRANYKTGSPLVVLRDVVYNKGFKMFKYLGIENG